MDELTRRTRVYIAGPYTKPDPCANTSKAMDVWDYLFSLGYAPFCPHWSHFQHTCRPRPYSDWLSFDLEWLACCDTVVRLPGESSGADKECLEAERLGIPVLSLERLIVEIPTMALATTSTDFSLSGKKENPPRSEGGS